MASPGNQHCASCIGTLSFPAFLRPCSLQVDEPLKWRMASATPDLRLPSQSQNITAS